MDKWLTQEEAANEMGCSVRTISRRVAAGKLRCAHENGRTMVRIDECGPSDLLDQSNGELSEVTTATSIERSIGVDHLAPVLSAMSDMRAMYERSEERAAHLADSAIRVRRWTLIGAAVVMVAGLATVALLAVNYHHAQIDHLMAMNQMETAYEMMAAQNAVYRREMETGNATAAGLSAQLVEAREEVGALRAQRDAVVEARDRAYSEAEELAKWALPAIFNGTGAAKSDEGG